MTTDKIKVLALMLGAVLAVSLGEAMMAKGLRHHHVVGGLFQQIRGILGNGQVVVGTLLMATYFGLYMLAVRLADFSFVLPLTGISYLLGAVLAKFYLGETVTSIRWIGALIITIGVAIVGLGDSGASHKP